MAQWKTMEPEQTLFSKQSNTNPWWLSKQIVIATIIIVGAAAFFVGTQVSSGSTAGAPDGADLTTLFKAWELLDKNFVAASTTEALTLEEKVWGATSGLAAAFGDPYTVFLPPEEKTVFETQVRGDFQGVGMEVGIKDNTLIVISPIKDTPAFRAGIQSGDYILKIDDFDTAGASVEEAVSKIRGEKGTTVRLTLLRGKKEPFEVSVTRDVINLPTIDTTYRDDGVFVIQLYSFNSLSPQLFRNAIQEFANSGSERMVLDLRGNPGGFLEAAVDIASWFLPVGKTVVTEDFGGGQSENVHRSRGYDVFTDRLKLVILIDQGSASASEILAGALRDHEKGILMGGQSFGKGSVQQVFDITNDTSLKITVARWLTPNHISISHGGLTPDIKVERTEEDRKANKDPQLEEAVKYLLSK